MRSLHPRVERPPGVVLPPHGIQPLEVQAVESLVEHDVTAVRHLRQLHAVYDICPWQKVWKVMVNTVPNRASAVLEEPAYAHVPLAARGQHLVWQDRVRVRVQLGLGLGLGLGHG